VGGKEEGAGRDGESVDREEVRKKK